ncbi:hypothetical protein H6F43_04310 [Leptolyngbya sp. FACHB-36]|uniref:hypothetical protein n=1 Tax=Leptolyngbya sp. FACHB-36 TaxID=2692808 RepID=UPI00167FEB39|nr:hypothetical protein [Leptolyngbya sp. FACHB-36]MBD2019407.1 hypothetical protein [Leptolyngbya sp. FACHB-36]
MNHEETALILETALKAAQSAVIAANAALEALNQRKQEADENRWISLSEAVAALGPGFSIDMLRERCTDGRFKHGTHFINTSDGSRPNYLLRVASVRKYFETEPERRSPTKLRRIG